MGPKVLKMVWILSGLEPFVAPSSVFSGSFFCSVFGMRPRHDFGPFWAPNGAQEAPKMKPCWLLFESGWNIENVCFIIVKLYFLRSREVPGANFFQTAFSECLRRGPGEHFCRFSMIWGALWGPLGLHLGSKSTTLGLFFRSPILGVF